jgi:hypothetical protein
MVIWLATVAGFASKIPRKIHWAFVARGTNTTGEAPIATQVRAAV